jgi:diguanylate cyclase (GGDEF)-like protein
MNPAQSDGQAARRCLGTASYQAATHHAALVYQFADGRIPFENDRFGLMLVGQGGVGRCNRKLETLLGYGENEIEGLAPTVVFPEEEWNARSGAELSRPGSSVTLELTARGKDDRMLPVRATIHSSFGPGGQPLWMWIVEPVETTGRADDGSVHESTNELQAEHRLAAVLASAIHSHWQLAVLRIGLDRHRDIHDVMGRDKSDRLILGVVSRIRDVLRPIDILVRSSVDEFMAVLVGHAEHPEETLTIGRRILDRIAEPVQVDGRALFTSARIGVACSRQHGTDAATLLGKADVALRASRAAHGNPVTMFTDQLSRETETALRLEQDLRGALTGGQFSLAYQPIIDLGQMTTSSFEALLRWRLPDGRQIGPAQFIPLAEETGLILPIGRWVLREACRQAVAWKQTGTGAPPIAVNLSAYQLGVPDLAASILGTLAEFGVEPSALQLEITETSLIDRIDEVAPMLKTLTDAGIRLAIDDFGTGYSSLSYLRKLPVDTIKIDRAFIGDLHTDDAGARTVVAAIIDLARRLGLSTIAEGIETQEQLDILRSMGCDRVQGMYLSPPVSSELAESIASQKFQMSWNLPRCLAT